MSIIAKLNLSYYIDNFKSINFKVKYKYDIYITTTNYMLIIKI